MVFSAMLRCNIAAAQRCCGTAFAVSGPCRSPRLHPTYHHHRLGRAVDWLNYYSGRRLHGQGHPCCCIGPLQLVLQLTMPVGAGARRRTQ